MRNPLLPLDIRWHQGSQQKLFYHNAMQVNSFSTFQKPNDNSLSPAQYSFMPQPYSPSPVVVLSPYWSRRSLPAIPRRSSHNRFRSSSASRSMTCTGRAAPAVQGKKWIGKISNTLWQPQHMGTSLFSGEGVGRTGRNWKIGHS